MGIKRFKAALTTRLAGKKFRDVTKHKHLPPGGIVPTGTPKSLKGWIPNGKK